MGTHAWQNATWEDLVSGERSHRARPIQKKKIEELLTEGEGAMLKLRS